MKRRYIKIYLINILLFYSNISVFAGLQFDDEIASFNLKNSYSKIRIKPSTIYGCRDASIVNNVSGIGLGNYNLKQYDYNLDNIITYTDVSNGMEYINWNIPENTTVKIKENIIIDGYGGTINLGENSQIFINSNVTLTLRNVIIKNSNNSTSNPPIELESNTSKLALDNAKLNLVNDFYFDYGQFFIHNDVSINGTTSFIFRGNIPSFITQNSTLKFSPETTFYFKPTAPESTNLLPKDFLIMQDATSKLLLDGCSLKTTITGIRLTKGQLIFENKVTLSSNGVPPIINFNNWTSANYGSFVYSVDFSTDNKYLAVGGQTPTSGNEIQILSFNGLSLSLTSSQDYGSVVYTVNWSPDGQYLAVGGNGPSSGHDEIDIYSFNGSTLTRITSKDYGSASSIRSIKWSPSGQYLAVNGLHPSSGYEVQVYSFNGSTLSLVAQAGYTYDIYTGYAADWSPNEQYLAVGFEYNPGQSNNLLVYSFNGSSLNLVASTTFGLYDDSTVYAVKWSPDGNYLAAGGQHATKELKIYSFNGSSLSLVTYQDFGYRSSPYPKAKVSTVYWNPDGQYLAAGGNDVKNQYDIKIYKFNGSALTSIAETKIGTVLSICWSSNNYYLATGGYSPPAGHDEIDVYTLIDPPQAVSNSIVFGNSALGSIYDLNVIMRAGANVEVDGIVNYDNVN